MKLIWAYDIQLWGCAKPSNAKVIKNSKYKVLRSVTNAPWHVSNFTLHNDLQITFVIEEIRVHRLSTLYHGSILGHNNRLAAEISNPPNVWRRLRRQWPSDLPQPADEEN
jgi:hypothetical protein